MEKFSKSIWMKLPKTLPLFFLSKRERDVFEDGKKDFLLLKQRFFLSACASECAFKEIGETKSKSIFKRKKSSSIRTLHPIKVHVSLQPIPSQRIFLSLKHRSIEESAPHTLHFRCLKKESRFLSIQRS